MQNSIEYSDACLNKSRSLWQYYRDKSALDKNNNIIDFLAGNTNSIQLKFKQQVTGQTGNGGTKDFEIMLPLTYLTKFWRTLEMLLINCEISLQLKWYKIVFQQLVLQQIKVQNFK